MMPLIMPASFACSRMDPEPLEDDSNVLVANRLAYAMSYHYMDISGTTANFLSLHVTATTIRWASCIYELRPNGSVLRGYHYP